MARSSRLISLLPHRTVDHLTAQLHSPLHAIPSAKLPVKLQVPCLMQVSPSPMLTFAEPKHKKSLFCLPLPRMSVSHGATVEEGRWRRFAPCLASERRNGKVHGEGVTALAACGFHSALCTPGCSPGPSSSCAGLSFTHSFQEAEAAKASA